MSRYAPQGSQARVNSRVFCSGGSLGAALAGPDYFQARPHSQTARDRNSHQRPSWSRAGAVSLRPSGREISVDRMSYKTGLGLSRPCQSFGAPLQMARLLADPGFTPASSGLENGFFRTADQIPPQRTREVRWR
jgi:hypothetical protein